MPYLRNVQSITAADAGNGPVSVSLSDLGSGTYRLKHVTLGLSAAPTTSESFTITWNKAAGSEYDVLLYTEDLSVLGTYDLVAYPEKETDLQPGDTIDVAYTNSDGGTYGVEITAEVV